MKDVPEPLIADQPQAVMVVQTADGMAVVLSFQVSDGREFHFALTMQDAYRIGAELCDTAAGDGHPW